MKVGVRKLARTTKAFCESAALFVGAVNDDRVIMKVKNTEGVGGGEGGEEEKKVNLNNPLQNSTRTNQ